MAAGVKYIGGPWSSARCVSAATRDSCFVVVKASPATRVRSESRSSEMCPGEWPGVGIQRQPGAPGTLPSAGSSRAC